MALLSDLYKEIYYFCVVCILIHMFVSCILSTVKREEQIGLGKPDSAFTSCSYFISFWRNWEEKTILVWISSLRLTRINMYFFFTYVLIRGIITNERNGIVKTSEIIKLLKKAGCYEVREGGKHDIWYSPITNMYFPVWHHKKEIPTGTAEKIMKEAGI